MKILEKDISPTKRNYLKIETSGLSKDMDTIVSIGIVKKYSQTMKIFYIENFKDEEKLLREVLPIIEEKNFVTYSGKYFDLPFLKAKYDFYFSRDININLEDLQEFTKNYNFIFKLPSHSNKTLLKDFVKDYDNNKNKYEGIKIKSLFKKHIEGDEKALDKILEYSFESIKNLIKLDENIKKTFKNKIELESSNSKFYIEKIKILGNSIIIKGSTTYKSEYFSTNHTYTLEIFNNIKNYSLLDLKEDHKYFEIKINTEDGFYDKDNKCYYLVKNNLPFEIKNISKIKSPSKILILYYKNHIFENQKEICKKILDYELENKN